MLNEKDSLDLVKIGCKEYINDYLTNNTVLPKVNIVKYDNMGTSQRYFPFVFLQNEELEKNCKRGFFILDMANYNIMEVNKNIPPSIKEISVV